MCVEGPVGTVSLNTLACGYLHKALEVLAGLVVQSLPFLSEKAQLLFPGPSAIRGRLFEQRYTHEYSSSTNMNKFSRNFGRGLARMCQSDAESSSYLKESASLPRQLLKRQALG